jgi:hypothetical protein
MVKSLSLELDGLGGNVGLSTPYIELTTFPAPDVIPSWDYLYEEHPMYVNGRRVTTTLDGLAIDSKLWHNLINSGRIGGQFGLLQMRTEAARPRLVQVGLITGEGNLIGGAGDEAAFRDIAKIHDYTLYRLFVVNDNWSFGAALSGFRQTKEDETKIDSRLPKNLKAGVVEISNRSNCKDALQALFLSLKNRKFGDYESLDLEVLFNRISSFEINPTLTPPNEFGMGATAPIVNGKRIVAYAIELPSPNSSVRFNQYIKVAIAELLHHARKKGVYRDDDLDKAAGDLMTKDNYNAQLKLMKDGNYRVCFIGHNYINKFCNYSEEEIKNGIPLAGN